MSLNVHFINLQSQKTQIRHSHIADGSTFTAGDIAEGDITAERSMEDAGDCDDKGAIAGDAWGDNGEGAIAGDAWGDNGEGAIPGDACEDKDEGAMKGDAREGGRLSTGICLDPAAQKSISVMVLKLSTSNQSQVPPCGNNFGIYVFKSSVHWLINTWS